MSSRASRHPFPLRAGALLAAALAAPAAAQQAQQQVRPPIANYWMDVGTNHMSIPGMPAASSGGLMGGMAGGAGGPMAGMGGPARSLFLALYTRNKPQGADGLHTTPPPSRFDRPLPLVPHRPQPEERQRRSDEPDEPQHEKPRARLLMYWGCGETVRQGQPRVVDTSTMSPVEFGRAMTSRSAPDRGPSRAAGRSFWPNPIDPRPVAADASLLGGHQVGGDGVPDIRFAIGAAQDFMAPMEIALSGGGQSAVDVQWKPLPTARAYFAQAIGSRGEDNRSEMIIWTSSELPETGFGLMDYLPNNLVDRWVGEKVLMPSTASRCAIPKGVFDGVEGAMVRMIAYGEELNLVHPPRPSDPKVTWEQVWSARVRVKSTGLAMLDAEGMRESAGRGRRPAGAAPSAADRPAAPADTGSQPPAASTPTDSSPPPSSPGGLIPGINPGDLLRGILRR
jgi:hypothetical protein